MATNDDDTSSARESARHSDGKFGVQPLDEAAGVDLSVEAAVGRIVGNEQNVHAVKVLNDSDLPGIAMLNTDGSNITYLDECGDTFTVSVLDGSVSVWSEDTGAHASSTAIRIGGTDEDASARADADLVRLVRSTQRRNGDIRAFNASALPAIEKIAGTSAHTDRRFVIDSYGGKFDVVDPTTGDWVVCFSEYDSHNPDFDAPTMTISLDDLNSEQFLVVADPTGTEGGHRFVRGDGSPLAGWESRGLEAEINRLADCEGAPDSLVSDLMDRASAHRRASTSAEVSTPR